MHNGNNKLHKQINSIKLKIKWLIYYTTSIILVPRLIFAVYHNGQISNLTDKNVRFKT